MKSAEEEYIEIGLKYGFINGLSVYSNTETIKEKMFEFAQAYASYRIEQLLDVEEEIKEKSLKYSVYHSESMHFRKGAKWLLETLKNKANTKSKN